MKNKKLFAILTLVCFMFTLMPVAAFASYDTYAELSDTSVTTLESDVTVTIFDADPEKVHYVYAVKDGALYTDLGGATANGVKVVAAGTTTAAISFPNAGTYKVYVAPSTGTGLDNIVTGVTYANAADRLEALNEAAEAVEIDKNTVRVKAVAGAYTIGFAGADIPTTGVNADKLCISADNGFGSSPVTVTLEENGEAIKGAEIAFSTNSGYVTVTAIDDVTDRSGDMDIKVAATKAGNYKIYAKYNNKTEILNVVVGAIAVNGVKTVAEPKAPVALDSALARYTGIAFEFVDGNGTVLKSGLDFAGEGKNVAVSVIEKPADSVLGTEGHEVTLRYDNVVNNAWTLSGAESFDEEGKYTFKVALENGASATASVNVKEFGEPVSMMLIYNQNTIALGGEATVKALNFLDANGVTKAAAETAYAVEYVANGLAVDGVVEEDVLAEAGDVDEEAGIELGDVLEAKGTIYAKDADEVVGLDAIGSTITVMAICDQLELTATANLKVVNDAVALKYVTTNADIAVNNNIVVKTVDVDGNVVDVAGLAGADVKVYVTTDLKNAKYAANLLAVKDSSTLILEFTASAAGEYKVQTIVKVGSEYISGIETITVGGDVNTFNDVVVISMGADSMIVNNELVKLDVAPYIENNRTMMQYNVLGVFGFDIQWVQETRSVVAEGNGIKVVMNIDSKVAVVNGEEVTLDVAPTIVNGRTVVPVGFLTGTFGITPNFIYGETGLDSILFAK